MEDSWFSVLGAVIRAIIPSSSTDPKEQLIWRWAVAIGLLLGLSSIAGGLAWAQGWVPGIYGVASKRDLLDAKDDVNHKLDLFNNRVSKIEQTTDSINLRLIKNDIHDALVQSCAAQVQGNQQALDNANQELFGNSGTDGLLD